VEQPDGKPQDKQQRRPGTYRRPATTAPASHPPQVAIERLGGATSTGFIASAEGIGGMIGAAVAMRLKPKRLLQAGWLTLMLMPLWALAYVWPAQLTAVLAGAIIGYAGLIYFDVAWETAIQDHVPHRALGRVGSWDTTTSFIAMPVGNVPAGPLSQTYGIDRVLTVCAAVLFTAALSQLFIPATRRLTRPTPEQTEPPTPLLDAMPHQSKPDNRASPRSVTPP
jgi:hypothetical protein